MTRERDATLLKTSILVSAIAGFALLAPSPGGAKLRWLARQLAERDPEVLYFVNTRERVVALTIDDSPDSITTPRILDVLGAHGARATFFIITGRVPGHEPLLRRMVQEQHELANHLTRDEPSIRLPPELFEQHLEAAHQVLRQYAEVRFFRPGSGRFSRAMLETLAENDYQCVLGSVYPFDPHIPSAWFSTRFILWAAQPGSIIILHDVGGRGERTVRTLQKILPELDRRGYRVVTVSDLVALEAP